MLRPRIIYPIPSEHDRYRNLYQQIVRFTTEQRIQWEPVEHLPDGDRDGWTARLPVDQSGDPLVELWCTPHRPGRSAQWLPDGFLLHRYQHTDPRTHEPIGVLVGYWCWIADHDWIATATTADDNSPAGLVGWDDFEAAIRKNINDAVAQNIEAVLASTEQAIRRIAYEATAYRNP